MKKTLIILFTIILVINACTDTQVPVTKQIDSTIKKGDTVDVPVKDSVHETSKH